MINTQHVGVYGVLVHDDKLLMIKKARGPYKGQLDLPGGRIEHGESFEEALKREFDEEVGLEITQLKFLTIDQITVDYLNSASEQCSMHHIAIFYLVSADKPESIKLDGDDHDSNGALYIDLNSLEQFSFAPMVTKIVNKYLLQA